MKREVKPFVVEVKRGKRRQSFLGQREDEGGGSNEASRRADSLFAGPGSDGSQGKSPASEPAGRILQSLIEPPPPDLPEEEEAQPRRRGRKPGSKNKPKSLAPTPVPPSPSPTILAGDPAEEDVFDLPVAPTLDLPDPAPVIETMSERAGEPTRRRRLRDRSRILARFVHKTAPAPGERWMHRKRRFRRNDP